MMKVGVIGCGNIADIYFKNSKQYFNNFEIVACADIKEEASPFVYVTSVPSSCLQQTVPDVIMPRCLV